MAENTKTYKKYIASLQNIPRKATGFIVKTELRLSKDGGGIGLFAGEFLPKNTRIDDGNLGLCFTKQELVDFIGGAESDEERKWWLEHMYGNEGKMWLNMDDLDTMMLNHCAKPTIVMLPEGDFTTRDIKEGEELTENYGDYESLDFYEDLCKKYGAIDFDNSWN